MALRAAKAEEDAALAGITGHLVAGTITEHVSRGAVISRFQQPVKRAANSSPR